MGDISNTNNSFGNRVVNKLPETILDLLNRDQKRAFVEAVSEIRSQDWMDIHNVDVRYSIPLPKGRYYLRIISGPERRPNIRIHPDSKRSKLRLLGKVLLIGISAAILYSLAGLGFLFFSSVLH